MRGEFETKRALKSICFRILSLCFSLGLPSKWMRETHVYNEENSSMTPFAKNLLASQLYGETNISFTKISLCSSLWKRGGMNAASRGTWSVITRWSCVINRLPNFETNLTVASFSSQQKDTSTTISQEKDSDFNNHCAMWRLSCFDLTLPHRNLNLATMSGRLNSNCHAHIVPQWSTG